MRLRGRDNHYSLELKNNAKREPRERKREKEREREREREKDRESACIIVKSDE